MTAIEPEILTSPLSTDEQKQLEQLEMFAHWLDSVFQVPGTRFRVGWDSIIGLIPGIGDLVTAAISGWIILQAKQLGVSRWTLLRMLANLGADTVLGAVPLAGDAFDAAFKANQKNLALLRRHLEKQTKVTRQK